MTTGGVAERSQTIVAGTDAIPGFARHRELENYVTAGIPSPKVLQLATLGAARVMKHDDQSGSIAPGKVADLILVEGDPVARIADIRRVVPVIKDGTIYDAAALYKALGSRPGKLIRATASSSRSTTLPSVDSSRQKKLAIWATGIPPSARARSSPTDNIGAPFRL